MRTSDPRLVLALLCAASSGCASLSTRDDLARVRDLAHVSLDVGRADRSVGAETDEDAHALLHEALTPDTAVRIALLNNRELRATYREIGITRGRLVQAGLLPNPTVEFEYLPERQSQFELRIEYDLTSLLLAPVRAGAMRPELEAERFRAAAATIDLGYRVRAAFHAAQASSQQLVAATQALDALAAARDATQAIVAAGNLRLIDLANQDAAYQDARVVLADVALRVQEDRERLDQLLGLTGAETTWRIAEPLAPVPDELALPDAIETHAIEASLDLREQHERLEGAARRAGFARARGATPDVAVDVHVLQGAAENVTAVPNAPWQLGAGVRVTIPVFDRQQGMVATHAADFDARMERYHGTAITIRSVARTLRNRLASAHARARLYDTSIVPARTRVLEQSVLQYNAMQISVFQLLAARRQQLDATMGSLAARRDYWTARAALDALLAGHRVDAANTPTNEAMATDAASAMEGH